MTSRTRRRPDTPGDGTPFTTSRDSSYVSFIVICPSFLSGKEVETGTSQGGRGGNCFCSSIDRFLFTDVPGQGHTVSTRLLSPKPRFLVIELLTVLEVICLRTTLFSSVNSRARYKVTSTREGKRLFSTVITWFCFRN